MPNVKTDLQRKYKYKATFTINSSGTPHNEVPVDEFTPPDRRKEPVTRQNRKYGQIVLSAPTSYGEMTMRLALRITGDSANATASLISDLQSLADTDADTCNVYLNTIADVDGSEQVSYKQIYSNCRLTGFKVDSLNRHGDDEMLHIEMSLIPSHVSRIKGDQVEGA
jgi:hypothetical protein